MSQFIAYYRRSTKSQHDAQKQKYSFDRQAASVQRYVENGEVIASFFEEESGTKNNRPELEAALKLCKATGATLVIASLSRLSRSVRFVSQLIESQVNFVCCDNPHANKLTLQLLSVVNEHEVDCLRERIKQGLAEAKKKGVVLGNPRLEETAHPAAARVNKERGLSTLNRYFLDISTAKEFLLNDGQRVNSNTISQHMNQRGIKSPRNGSISRAFVMSILKRAVENNLLSVKTSPSLFHLI